MKGLAAVAITDSLHFFMRAGVIGLRLRHVALGVLHKLGLGCLAAEAVGLAIDHGADRTIRTVAP